MNGSPCARFASPQFIVAPRALKRSSKWRGLVNRVGDWLEALLISVGNYASFNALRI